MQTMRFNKLLIALLITLAVTSCRKDDVSDPKTILISNEFESIEVYNIELQGIVKNVEGESVEGALVQAAGQQAITSENGVFSLSNLSAPETGLYVKIEAEGYFVGGTSIYANENQTYSIELTLVPFHNYNQFNASEGMDQIMNDGSRIIIPSDGLIDDSGNLYSGQVDFYSYWINPSDDRMPELSPGALVGNQNDDLFALRSFGMIAVELRGEAGQELNLAEGIKSTLRFPIPSEMLSDAEEQIDLWHFNESTGNWDHEGVAILENGAYLADVPHFSWWNCDIPFNLTNLCFNIVDNFGDPVGNVNLTVFADGFGYASVFVGPQGVYCDLVPAGQNLEVSLTTFCGDELYSTVIQAVAEDESVDIVVPIGSGSLNEVNISGVVSCPSTGTIENGYVVLELGDQTYLDYVGEDGSYSLDIINCQGIDHAATLIAYDLDELTGGTEEILIQSDDLELDISACEESLTEDLFIIALGADTHTMLDCKANISSAEITIIAQDLIGGNDQYAILGVKGFSENNFGGNLFSSYWSGMNLNAENQISVTIEHYTEVPGEQIVGSFSYNGEVSGNFIATVQ